MANERRIPGSPGTQPPTANAPGAVADPTPGAPVTPGVNAPARLVREGGRLYAVRGNMRIPVEDPRLISPSQPAPAPPLTQPIVLAPAARALSPAIDAAALRRDELLQLPGVVDVRAGYVFKDGVITQTPAVVVAVTGVAPGARFDKAEIAAQRGIPSSIAGVPVDLELANPYQRLRRSLGAEAVPASRLPRLLIDELQAPAEGVSEAVPAITYEPPPGGNLEPITGAMSITCHVSPDAGWRVLKPFLAATERKLHLGMYDFTAPHIYQTARALLKETDVEWQQVLGPKESLPQEGDADSTKADDLTEVSVVRGLERVARDRFGNVFARVGAGRTFASAYHIKVAVRDDKAFWLSSGNWQSSNQPDIDFFDEASDRQLISRYNREWHVVCENATLAKRLQRFLDHDFETATSGDEMEAAAVGLPDLVVTADELLAEERAGAGLEVFAPRKFVFTSANPVTVQPILTPDNFMDVVLKFLRQRPARTLYFQNQSLNPIQSPTAEYAELLELLARYSNDASLDVRIIFRNIGPVRKKLESLQAAGFNMSRIRMQAGCHTKGIIVDSQTILLGSHNITNQGVQVNRDASLLIEDPGIAQYYEAVFLHDWAKLSRPAIREGSSPVPVGSEEAAMAGGGS